MKNYPSRFISPNSSEKVWSFKNNITVQLIGTIIVCKGSNKSVTNGEWSLHVGVKQFQKEEQKRHNNK